MINGYSYHLHTSTPNDQHTRKDVQKLINAALDSVDPFLAVKKFLRYDGQILKAGEQSYVRADYRSIFLVAIGKAAIPMVISASEVLKDDYSSGLAITKKLANTGAIDHKIRVLIGDHPIPGEKSLKAADEVITFLGNITPDDLVIFLISGGGSALISKPITGISFGDIQAVTRGLVNASVSIQQINTIRKHLDIVKGGGLLKMVSPARVISLILSDVIGNDLSVIASGPTVPDPSSFQDCLEIISSNDLMDKIPESVLSFLRDGAEGKQDETIKPAQVDVKLHDEILIGSIDLAIKALMQTGGELGYRTKLSAKYLMNDIEFEKNRIIKECSDLFTHDGKQKSIMVWGGEVTVKRSAGGRGGRNQHLALLLAEEFKGMKGVVGVALATDGEDGSTDAAGAVIDSTTLGRAGVLGLDYQRAIREQESYGFFQKLNDLIYTGPTGTNVNDLFFIIKEDLQNGYKE
jgi:glycerate 2-kinase